MAEDTNKGEYKENKWEKGEKRVMGRKKEPVWADGEPALSDKMEGLGGDGAFRL